MDESTGNILDNVKISDEEFDAIYFKKNEDDERLCQLMTMKLEGENKFKHHPHCDGFLYSILISENSEIELGMYELEYYEAYLGDPFNFVKSQLKTNAQGFVVKKCYRGLKILEDLMKQNEDFITHGKIKQALDNLQVL